MEAREWPAKASQHATVVTSIFSTVFVRHVVACRVRVCDRVAHDIRYRCHSVARATSVEHVLGRALESCCVTAVDENTECYKHLYSTFKVRTSDRCLSYNIMILCRQSCELRIICVIYAPSQAPPSPLSPRHPLLRRNRDHINFAAEQKEERKRKREANIAEAEKAKEALLAKANEAAVARYCMFWKQGNCANRTPPHGKARTCREKHGTPEETAAIKCFSLSESGKKGGWVCDPNLCPYDHTPVSGEEQAANAQVSNYGGLIVFTD